MSDVATEDIRAAKYVLYARKSTEDSEKQVRSIEDQIKECREYADRLGLNVVEPPITEEGSAKKPNRRPKFNELLKRIERGEVDGILAWHPDRLARNMMEGGIIIQLLDDAKLMDLKFSSFPFTNDASGKMMLGIAFALSKHYSEKLSTDVKRGLLNGLREGKSAGQYKPGYVRDGKLKLYYRDDNNFPIVAEAWAMKLARTPEHKIVEMMNARGYRRIIKKENTKLNRSQPMSVQKLNDMFRDPIYCGILKQGTVEVPLADLYEFEPMITKAEFDAVQKMQRGHGKEKVKYDLPLRGLVLCNLCKKPRVAAPSMSRNKRDRFIYFRCGTEGCPEKGKSVRAITVLNYITELLRNISIDGIDHAQVQKFLHNYVKNSEKENAAELKRLKTERTKAETELNEMAVRKAKVSFDKGELEAYEQEKQRLRSLVSKNDGRIDELEVQQVFSAVDVEAFLNTLKTAADDYELMDHTHKDLIARMLILNISTEGGEVASVTLNPPFDELIKRPVFSDGGPGGS